MVLQYTVLILCILLSFKIFETIAKIFETTAWYAVFMIKPIQRKFLLSCQKSNNIVNNLKKI